MAKLTPQALDPTIPKRYSVRVLDRSVSQTVTYTVIACSVLDAKAEASRRRYGKVLVSEYKYMHVTFLNIPEE